MVFVVQEQGRPALPVIFQRPGGVQEGETGEEPRPLHGIIEEAFKEPPGPDHRLFLVAAGHLATPEIGAAVEHGADVGIILGIELDGGARGPFQALEIAGHHLLLQGVRSEGDQPLLALRRQKQVVQHQASEDHAQKADMERGQQKGGLLGMEPQVQDRSRQFQADHMGQPFPLPGHQVGVDGPPDFHQMALEVHGKTRKKFQPFGLRGHNAAGVVRPLQIAGADVVDQPQHFGAVCQRFQLGGKEFAVGKP